MQIRGIKPIKTMDIAITSDTRKCYDDISQAALYEGN